MFVNSQALVIIPWIITVYTHTHNYAFIFCLLPCCCRLLYNILLFLLCEIWFILPPAFQHSPLHAIYRFVLFARIALSPWQSDPFNFSTLRLAFMAKIVLMLFSAFYAFFVLINCYDFNIFMSIFFSILTRSFWCKFLRRAEILSCELCLSISVWVNSTGC